ncbi:uncharacterized protein JN550_013798 [Neoarthrinium moseri]|uniref:uncharacterized protein n=1 Tax=Neoarthrinium moseri TaxID=1658444 RepID=UPI001FDB7B24|nr:uncharacterized protein JN550_013798 [Neoarthrinium moseri]KAI1856485.1 hypothetical protein JN550_013798 [Neoarthrinium moseri]
MEAASSSTARFPAPRRVATEPAPFAPRRSLSVSSTSSRPGTSSGPKGGDESIETLYNHPSVKIIAFTSSQRPSYGGATLFEDPKPGSLPASTQLERTIAVGPFRIYRAPGSVAFLSCGSALQPILPKSQCWCIDEANSRFVLQIRRPQYWRIEVPVSDPEDAHRALVLRDVLDSILLFEKTECPFQRSFTVALPERPQTPVKKKPWTAEGKNLISSAFSSDISPPLPSRKITNDKKRTSVPVEQVADQGEVAELQATVHDSPRFEEIGQTEPLEGANPRKEPQEAGAGQETTPEVSSTKAETSPPDSVASGLEIFSGLKASDQQPLSTQAREVEAHTDEPARPQATSSADRPSKSADEVPTASPLVPTVSPSSNEKATKTCILPPSRVSPAVGSGPPAPVQHDRAKAPVAHPEVPTSSVESDQPIPSAVTSTGDSLVKTTQEATPPPPDNPVVGIQTTPGAEETEPQSFEGAGSVGTVNLKKKRMSRMLAGRSVTLPLQLTIVTSPPTKTSQGPLVEASVAEPSSSPLQPSLKADDTSPVGSMDSFHSVQSWHSPITPLPPSPPSSSPSPPSFPYPHEDIIIPSKGQSSIRDASGSAATPVTANSPDPSSPAHSSKPSSPTIVLPADSESHPSALPERLQARHRQKGNNLSISRRALSPLPPAANLFSPQVRRRPSRLELVRKLPSAIIHKTVEILLSPPSHLVSLMLKVAAKIAAGEWRGLVFGLGEGGESIPVHWDYSDDELSTWEDDDDYTFSLGRFARRQNMTANFSDGQDTTRPENRDGADGNDRSWEVD